MYSKKLFYVTPFVIFFVSNILEKSLALPQGQEESKTKLGPPLDPVEGNPEEENEVPLELVVEIYQEGDCTLKEPVKEGDTLTVHYEGQLLNTNEQFQSSWDREEPYTFTMGKGQVVQGWEIGLQGICCTKVHNCSPR
ncbi:FK506-binding protein 2B [Armadillidium nasatum]|uniref:peptidylprolyl isomerase n=1 Tax=Armadillidium nasatum TaxID=96803 RepID=A0A5N5TGC3_9CRUS|nr:FK506-binding protein 2B [Armadillidium nasatum]